MVQQFIPTDAYDNQPTQYSISEKNIRDWFRNQKAHIIVPAIDRRHGEDKFTEFILNALDEMNKLRNG